MKEIMLTKNDLTKLFDTVLSIPGMNQMVKIDLKLQRKNVLLLNKVIERGLALNHEVEEGRAGLLELASPASIQELSLLAEDLLQKAGLTDLNEKLKSF